MNKLKKVIKLIEKKLTKKKELNNIKRIDTTKDDRKYSREIKKVINLLNYTVKSGTSYSGGQFVTGYHSFEINNYHFKGQRDPKLRFRNLPISLEGLSVLDIGCNQGGMLHAFAKEIKYGIGIDYDPRMINVANKIKFYTESFNLNYYVFNLEKEPLDYINDFLPEDKVDVVLLLAVCMWINNWREVILFSKSISNRMIFETNGKAKVQEDQVKFLKQIYQNVELVNERSEDDPSQKLRKLYYCH